MNYSGSLRQKTDYKSLLSSQNSYSNPNNLNLTRQLSNSQNMNQLENIHASIIQNQCDTSKIQAQLHKNQVEQEYLKLKIENQLFRDFYQTILPIDDQALLFSKIQYRKDNITIQDIEKIYSNFMVELQQNPEQHKQLASNAIQHLFEINKQLLEEKHKQDIIIKEIINKYAECYKTLQQHLNGLISLEIKSEYDPEQVVSKIQFNNAQKQIEELIESQNLMKQIIDDQENKISDQKLEISNLKNKIALQQIEVDKANELQKQIEKLQEEIMDRQKFEESLSKYPVSDAYK